MKFNLRILEDPDDLAKVEDLQRIVWPGSETDVIPSHLIRAVQHGGGVIIGAFAPSPDDEKDIIGSEERLVGFVFGFPGLCSTPEGPRLRHCSHMLATDPDWQNQGIGFLLKRAQWQMVRQQGIDRITWTFDPLLSRNAFLNIARLGATCNTYLPDFYGEMRDALNVGLATDRFEVDWWVNSRRVSQRLSRQARPLLPLAEYLNAQSPILNPAIIDAAGWPLPCANAPGIPADQQALCLVEIPADFQAMRQEDAGLAAAWRKQTRDLFLALFAQGYLVTDFIYERSAQPRSYYVLSFGDSTL